MRKIGCAVPVSKKSYLRLVLHQAGEVKVARRKPEFDGRELAERDGKLEELCLKVQLLADDSKMMA